MEGIIQKLFTELYREYQEALRQDQTDMPIRTALIDIGRLEQELIEKIKLEIEARYEDQYTINRSYILQKLIGEVITKNE